MDTARPSNPTELLSLQEAAQFLGVDIEVLLKWNEHHILKPTITNTGEIAYSKDQLISFKAIQSNSNQVASREAQASTIPSSPSHTVMPQNTPVVKNYNHRQQNNYAQINNYNFYSNQTQSKKEEPQKKQKSNTFSFLGVTATISIFAILVLSLFALQNSKVNNIINQASDDRVTYDSSNSTIRTLNEKESELEPASLIDNSKKVLDVKDEKLNNAFDKKDNKVIDIKNDEEKEILGAIHGSTTEENSNLITNTDAGIVTYGQKANLRENSYPEYSEEADAVSEVFDTEGNIKVSRDDPSESDLLATALGVNGFTQTQNIVKKNSTSTGMVTFIILGLIFIYFVYASRRQLLPSYINNMQASNHNDLVLQPTGYNTQTDIEWEKLIEVNQKTDGSVVINFQNKEYRISKPELDSESDKFIQRLMQLTNNGEKEIEYDILNDLELNTNTPLSKVVTRLGFVGLKRDLFFPRTSKSRVLFRKYLTLDDLFSMNLTIEDLSDRIDHVN